MLPYTSAVSTKQVDGPAGRRSDDGAVSGISYGTATVAGNGSIALTWQY